MVDRFLIFTAADFHSTSPKISINEDAVLCFLESSSSYCYRNPTGILNRGNIDLSGRFDCCVCLKYKRKFPFFSIERHFHWFTRSFSSIRTTESLDSTSPIIFTIFLISAEN